MILDFSVENFLSFSARQEISFIDYYIAVVLNAIVILYAIDKE